MYCSNCGKEINEKDLFCSSCGVKIGGREQDGESEQEYKKLEIHFTEQDLKWWIFKIIYIILVVCLWRQSQKGMFDIGGYYLMSIEGLMQDVFTVKQITEQSALVAKLCYWCFEVAIYGYVAAAVLALIQKEEAAKIFSGLGFLFHLPILCYAARGVMLVMKSWSFSEVYLLDAIEALNEEFWLYLALNIIIAICGVCFFSNVSTARQYNRKFNSIMKPEMVENKKIANGDWCCVECGKINASYVHTCSCGNNQDRK